MGNTLLRTQLRGRVAQWLRHGLAERGLTATALGEKSGVNRATISQILNCQADARDRTLRKLAKAMDWPLPGEGRSSSGDAAVMERGQTPYSGRTTSGDAAVGRRRTGTSGEAGERVAAVIASAIADVVRDVINRNELHGTREGQDALIQAIEHFAEELQRTGADVSELYRVALKLQRGQL